MRRNRSKSARNSLLLYRRRRTAYRERPDRNKYFTQQVNETPDQRQHRQHKQSSNELGKRQIKRNGQLNDMADVPELNIHGGQALTGRGKATSYSRLQTGRE